MTASQYPQSTAVGALNPMYDLADRATHLAARLLVSAKHGQNNQELAHGAKIARMMEDPLGKALTIALADQAFRSRDPARIADQLKHLIEQYGVPHYFAVWEQAGLMAAYVPQLIVPRVAARLRHETQDVILPAEEHELRAYLRERYRTGTRLNLNQLGEAILGEHEAQHRLRTYLSLLERDDVEYISVKISSIVSQINLVAFDQTLAAITNRLRILYRTAMTHHYITPSGQRVAKFVNLDYGNILPQPRPQED